MIKSKILKGLLIFLGLFLIAAGSFRLIDPVASFQSLGILLSEDVGLLNEARGSGGVLFGFVY